jgi:2,4'-dihydroxyacetophenone dioxygenase
MNVKELYDYTLKNSMEDRIIDFEKLPWVPTFEGVWFKPLRFDLTTGTFMHLTRIRPGGAIRKHRHSGGQVLFHTLQGQWRYLERNWVAKEGSLVWEPPGDIHTLVVEGDKDMIGFITIGGIIEYMDENDNLIFQDDVFYRKKKYEEYCKEQNIPIIDLCY